MSDLMPPSLCWKCSKPQGFRESPCPHCGATNPNVDLPKAVGECDAGSAGRTRPAETVTIDTGDTVLHRPTGETWVVACVQGERLSWCGWPEGMAALADCVLVEKATPEERRKLLEEWAKPVSCDRRNDHRHFHAIRQLEKEPRS